MGGWTYLTETPGILSVLKDLVDDGNRKFFFLVSEEIFGPALEVRHIALGSDFRSHRGHVKGVQFGQISDTAVGGGEERGGRRI